MNLENVNKYKKEIFESLLNRDEKFYCEVVDTPELVIGKRGLTLEEKENRAIILVFSKTSYINLTSDEHFIYCNMRFSGVWENLVIPIYAIRTIYDDPYKPTFIFRFAIFRPNTLSEPKTTEEKKKEDRKKHIKSNLKIIK